MTRVLLSLCSAVFLFCSMSLSAASFDQHHTLWNELLQTHVVDHGNYSQVNYQALKVDEAKLDHYLTGLSALTPTEFNSWNREQQLAGLINTYNAFTVKLILNHYPVKSIKDIGSFFTSSWKKKFFIFLGQSSHLDHIEHDLIRANDIFNEPRIHFALVCASIGCPKLHNQAFTDKNLETLLEAGAKSFLSDSSRNRFVVNKNLLQLSKIFDWYGVDFEKKFGSVLSYVAKYVTAKPNEQARIIQGKVELEHLDYNWLLNDVKL